MASARVRSSASKMAVHSTESTSVFKRGWIWNDDESDETHLGGLPLTAQRCQNCGAKNNNAGQHQLSTAKMTTSGTVGQPTISYPPTVILTTDAAVDTTPRGAAVGGFISEPRRNECGISKRRPVGRVHTTTETIEQDGEKICADPSLDVALQEKIPHPEYNKLSEQENIPHWSSKFTRLCYIEPWLGHDRRASRKSGDRVPNKNLQ
ncbi:serine protease [Culex quinquefasciatus]|uniref:Serine protease n=1 Tax=Culex quinquefasciatus TaxID=7176 RepID=B0XC89_CULQU|nr:serine protease [Culex quinquefasciatus]|eukprot:XP_001867261.1 serine protease [Culex quinquefasciatus]